jgi:hypothetical protein
MPPANQSREEERRHNTRTLAIASVASASAAAVTSQLWIAGTWIAAAVTPVLVTLISEAIQRPTERVARAWTADREPRGRARPRTQSATRGEPAAVTGTTGPVRMYRQTSRGVTEQERGRFTLAGRRIPWRAALLTAAAAFAIAIGTITAIDLASSGSVNTTPLGRKSSSGSATNDSTEKHQRDRQEQQQQQAPQQQSTTPDRTGTTTQQEQAPPPASDTTPTTPPAQTTPTAPLPDSTP